jgi:hypothetical protein
VRSAVFGPEPDPALVAGFISSKLFVTKLPLSPAKLAGLEPAGGPKKDYVFLSGSTGGAGKYQFGWVQELYLDNGTYGSRYEFVLYLFFHDGALEFSSRRSGENCLIPVTAVDSAQTPCAQIGQAAVELSSEYVVSGRLPGKKHTWTTSSAFRIRPGMPISEAKTAAAADVRTIDYKNKGELLIGGRNDCQIAALPVICKAITGLGSERFVYRLGRVYAREWRQTEFPDN